jgi:integrase
MVAGKLLTSGRGQRPKANPGRLLPNGTAAEARLSMQEKKSTPWKSRLINWTREQGYEFLHQIEKQAVREWRTTDWKYKNKTSSSLKVHWSVILTFFNWCVETDRLKINPCPSWSGKIEPTEVVPLTRPQINALIAAVDLGLEHVFGGFADKHLCFHNGRILKRHGIPQQKCDHGSIAR